MTILLLGGTGKTATRVATLLDTAEKPFLLASRRGPEAAPNGYPAVKFDWTDESTWTNAFGSGPVEAVYMMEPQVDKPWVPMIKFVDMARQKGVSRFVLCAGTTACIGKDGMGRVWEHFINGGVDYCVLRPSWFMGS
jgi:festuclavine dehydrogenase